MGDIQSGQPNAPEDTYRVLVLAVKEEHMVSIVEACKNAGQEVVPCRTIKQSFDFLESKDHVDVIVAEAFMEYESVFDFLKRAKASAELKDVPIIIMASEPGEIGQLCIPSVARTTERFGAYKFLVMPKLDVKQLVREIKAVLPLEKLPRREEDPSSAA